MSIEPAPGYLWWRYEHLRILYFFQINFVGYSLSVPLAINSHRNCRLSASSDLFRPFTDFHISRYQRKNQATTKRPADIIIYYIHAPLSNPPPQARSRESMSPDVRTWCSDALHGLLGFADSALAAYLASVAEGAGSPAEILQVLREGDVRPAAAAGGDALLSGFASELFERCHGGGGRSARGGAAVASASAAAAAPTHAEMVRRAAAYDLLEDDEDENGGGARPAAPAAGEAKAEGPPQEPAGAPDRKDRARERKRRHRRRRSASASSSSSSDGGGAVRRPVSRRRRREESPPPPSPPTPEGEGAERAGLTEEERAGLERERDLRERDEFAARLADRDRAKTRSVIDPKGKGGGGRDAADLRRRREETERRLARGEEVVDEATGKVVTVDRFREGSRRSYLKKREERQLTLLERELEDERELFGEGEEKLTAKERERIRLGREILKMARGRDKDGDEKGGEDDGFYRLPDEYEELVGTKAEKDKALLTSRYVEEKGEKSEQQLWEEEQTARAAGVGKKKGGAKGEEKEYDFVFEEAIDFVMSGTAAGYDKRDKRRRRRNADGATRSSRSRSRSRSRSKPGSKPVKEESNALVLPPLTELEKLREVRQNLPIFPYRQDLLAAIKDHQVLIVVAETGSGKTTQITQYLHEVGYSELGKIGCTQPRRVAAMSVAARVASEMGVRVGHEVGYSIRFENCTSKKTIIQYMTDGMLLREFLTEPDLASYSCLVIDEAHERTLHTDILFGLVKDIVRFRPDLKLIISSATLDAEKFSKYFDNASIFMVPGRMFPVDIYYTKSPEADYVDAAVVTVLQIHVTQSLDGDILVFLTGQEEIETAAEILTQKTRALGSRIKELIICPIYANLPSEQQAKIFEDTPKDSRKVVLATNIAETSLTINGICYVVDTGFNKQKSFNARSGMESLQVTPVSQAAANQRAGRSGRTQPGKCFRLFTSFSFHNELEVNTVPEIMRTNMCNVVLMLKSLGINDLLNFDFMDSPPAETLIRALEQLYALGSLNDRGELTKLGRRMAEFPLEPMLSKSVIVAEQYKCVSEVLSTVSMLSIGASVFYRPKEKAVHADTARMNFARGGGGDHISLLRCYREWAETDFSTQWCFENYVQVRSMRKARDIREQIEGLCERVEIDKDISSPDDMDATLKAITAGFFYNTAKLGKSGDYQTVKQHRTVYIHPSSVLAKEEELPGWLVYFELAFTTKEFMRQVAPIQPGWLIEIAPHFYKESDVQDARTKKMPKTRR